MYRGGGGHHGSTYSQRVVGWCFRLTRRDEFWKALALCALLIALIFIGLAASGHHNDKVTTARQLESDVAVTSSEASSLETEDVEVLAAAASAAAPVAADISERYSDSKRVTRRFVVDLGASASTRWRAVLKHFSGRVILKLARYLREFQHLLALQLGGARLVKEALMELAPLFDMEELHAVSRQLHLGVSETILLQLVYEAAAHCTSVVAFCRDTGLLTHGRVLDWDAPFMAHLTTEVEFRRRGQALFIATTWPGYLGVLTGMRENSMAISVNFRRKEGDDDDLLSTSLTLGRKGGYSLAGVEVRRVLSDDSRSYADAVAHLSRVALMSPCYFTISGVKSGQGVVLARSTDRLDHVTHLLHGRRRAQLPDDAELLSPSEVAEALVQANSDPGGHDVMKSMARTAFARSYLDSRNYKVNSQADMWRLLLSAPIFNEASVYATVMLPTKGSFETRTPRV